MHYIFQVHTADHSLGNHKPQLPEPYPHITIAVKTRGCPWKEDSYSAVWIENTRVSPLCYYSAVLLTEMDPPFNLSVLHFSHLWYKGNGWNEWFSIFVVYQNFLESFVRPCSSPIKLECPSVTFRNQQFQKLSRWFWFFFFFFGFLGQIRAAVAGLRHSHSNARSEQHLQPTSQLMATPDP